MPISRRVVKVRFVAGVSGANVRHVSSLPHSKTRNAGRSTGLLFTEINKFLRLINHPEVNFNKKKTIIKRPLLICWDNRRVKTGFAFLAGGEINLYRLLMTLRCDFLSFSSYVPLECFDRAVTIYP